MADREHLSILRAGVEAWNDWRTLYPNVTPDFSGAELEGIDLSAINSWDATQDFLVGLKLDMVRVDLRNANFSNAHLQGAKLVGADIEDTRFDGADLSLADLSLVHGARAIFYITILRNAKIRHAMLFHSHLSGCDLRGVDLYKTDISRTEASGALFSNAVLREVNAANSSFQGANLDFADLTYAWCVGADFRNTKLRHALLHGTNLQQAALIDVDLSDATLTDCSVHGVAAWDVVLDRTVQRNLVITKDPLFDEKIISVDDIQIAHFLYLLIENPKIRSIIDSVSAKVVLILGRFTPARISVLNAVREALQRFGYVPVLFDFDPPSSRDLTETVGTIAHLARFVLVDLTEAKSVPQELSAIVPSLPSVPVQPIVLAGDRGYAMFEHFRRYPWVLPEFVYADAAVLVGRLGDEIIPRLTRMFPR